MLPYRQVLQKIIKTIGKPHSIVLSDEDLFSLFLGEEQTFFAISAKAENIYILKHLSGHTCQKWAEIIGYYEKVDVGKSFSESGGLLFPASISGGSTVSLSDKREYVIRPEEITSMKEEQIYVISKNIVGVFLVNLI